MSMQRNGIEHYDTVVVGAGQAGLSVGHHLQRLGRRFVILDAGERVGDSWRRRWDSLRLFTPSWADRLTGMEFPAPKRSCPTKDEMADYLQAYAAHFELPVRLGVTVDRIAKCNGRFEVRAGERRFAADTVVVAMTSWQRPWRPDFADRLDPGVTALHSAEYRNPAQLADGGVLVVGAGNSGAEIALDVAGSHRVWLSGRHPGHVPFRIDGRFGRTVGVPLVLRVLFHRVATVHTPVGRKLRRRLRDHGMALVRARPRDLDAAGVERVPRVVGVRDGHPLLDDGRVLEVRNVIWATGYRPGYADFVDLPVLDDDGFPVHRRGVATAEPGLAFVGFPFVRAASGGMVHGLWTDARHVAEHVAAHGTGPSAGGRRASAPRPGSPAAAGPPAGRPR